MKLRSLCLNFCIALGLLYALFYKVHSKAKKIREGVKVTIVNENAKSLERNYIEYFTNLFQKRREHLSSYCSKKGDNGESFWEDKRVLYAYLIDRNRKLLVCGVPKSGSTSWQKALAAMTNPERFRNMKSLDIGRKIYSVAPHLDEIATKNKSLLMSALFEDKDYVRVISVRHPLTRLYSAWRQKFNVNFVAFPYFWRKYAAGAITRYQDGENSTDDSNYPFTFKSFVKFVANEGGKFSDWHWKPAVDYFCHPCKVEYDFVTFSDSLSEEANYILRDILVENYHRKPIEDWIQFPNRYKNSQTSKDILEKIYKDISVEDMHGIMKLYENDFEAFDFKF